MSLMVDDSLIGGKKLPPVLPGLFLFRLRARSARAALPGLLETLALEGASVMSISNPWGVCGWGGGMEPTTSAVAGARFRLGRRAPLLSSVVAFGGHCIN